MTKRIANPPCNDAIASSLWCFHAGVAWRLHRQVWTSSSRTREWHATIESGASVWSLDLIFFSPQHFHGFYYVSPSDPFMLPDGGIFDFGWGQKVIYVYLDDCRFSLLCCQWSYLDPSYQWRELSAEAVPESSYCPRRVYPMWSRVGWVTSD